MAARFYVIETRGYSIASGSSSQSTSFAVLDRLDCHREVAPGRFYVSQTGSSRESDRRRKAEAFAAKLNLWAEAWELAQNGRA